MMGHRKVHHPLIHSRPIMGPFLECGCLVCTRHGRVWSRSYQNFCLEHDLPASKQDVVFTLVTFGKKLNVKIVPFMASNGCSLVCKPSWANPNVPKLLVQLLQNDPAESIEAHKMELQDLLKSAAAGRRPAAREAAKYASICCIPSPTIASIFRSAESDYGRARCPATTGSHQP